MLMKMASFITKISFNNSYLDKNKSNLTQVA